MGVRLCEQRATNEIWFEVSTLSRYFSLQRTLHTDTAHNLVTNAPAISTVPCHCLWHVTLVVSWGLAHNWHFTFLRVKVSMYLVCSCFVVPASDHADIIERCTIQMAGYKRVSSPRIEGKHACFWIPHMGLHMYVNSLQ
jgi:hypothetical protein